MNQLKNAFCFASYNLSVTFLQEERIISLECKYIKLLFGIRFSCNMTSSNFSFTSPIIARTF